MILARNEIGGERGSLGLGPGGPGGPGPVQWRPPLRFPGERGVVDRPAHNDHLHLRGNTFFCWHCGRHNASSTVHRIISSLHSRHTCREISPCTLLLAHPTTLASILESGQIHRIYIYILWFQNNQICRSLPKIQLCICISMDAWTPELFICCSMFSLHFPSSFLSFPTLFRIVNSSTVHCPVFSPRTSPQMSKPGL